jgi:hypothetical protein
MISPSALYQETAGVFVGAGLSLTALAQFAT